MSTEERSTTNEPEQAGDDQPVQATQDEAAIARGKNLEDVLEFWQSGTHSCPICGTANEWHTADLADIPVRVPGSEIGTVASATSVFPVVPIYCGRCGYMQLLNQNILNKNAERKRAADAERAAKAETAEASEPAEAAPAEDGKTEST